ncbi:hypothetical protein FOH24_06935 [Acetobacter tropicalis]|uniref:Uncharacterized protein n=1 Tax=Acetobacter tropicalis TaxID=104102 RepID=A0A094YPG3_9PROT|nr:hypothetical protein [Acetobacter tropicalis]KAA8391133.1 hypothetical protein FOH22_00455 [Acetobacter tropicalis]KAA8391488.1 hypothetical protein FOH24_06935 [Acetobacter tropicalis]KGB23965.1 hypothetical protein AtDm6_1376 [Acetobacter tropicalis]MBC9009345.1 hypothetical protein [Acetobacter tropicalis]MDO8170612.1 hypothetical protein [Acetobacter tropicalis]
MTLAAILAPLLALCVVARGMGFLPVLGGVTAVAMLVDGVASLQETAAAFVLLFSIGPVWFLSYYQQDRGQERSGPTVPFFALGLMVVLLLASARSGAPQFPAGLCVVLAGLVAVTYRQAMIWQWAGLLTCINGVMLAGVIEKQVMVVGVAVLAGCVISVLGGLYVHRVMPRVAVVRASGRKDADRKSKPAETRFRGEAPLPSDPVPAFGTTRLAEEPPRAPADEEGNETDKPAPKAEDDPA